ncbi:MAG: hypothetical protein ABIZ57_08385 [Candidatus Limnocylindria bacterium]
MYRSRLSLAMTLLAILALLSACLTAGPGACGSDEREFFDAIEQFDGTPLEALDHPYGICGAVFTTDAPADAVVDHYVAEFEEVGWDVGAPEAEPNPGEPGLISIRTVSGYRDTFQYHVAISETEAGDVQVSVMAGDAQQ